MAENGKPGFMVYFSVEPALKLLDDTQTGQLFRAMLDFARDGVERDFGDPLLQMAWAFCRADLEADDRKYSEKVAKTRYAAYCKQEKAQGRTPVSLDEWTRVQTDANGRLHPSPIPNPIPETIPIQEQGQSNNNAAASPPPARFVPPDVGEVTDYCSEKGYNLDAAHFVDYYTARGWKLGNAVMSDWRAAVRSWASRAKDFAGGETERDFGRCTLREADFNG